MTPNKSTNEKFSIYCGVLSFFTIAVSIFSQGRTSNILLLLLLFFSIFPFLYYIYQTQKRFLFLFMIYYFLIGSIFLLSFRLLRDILIFPEIGQHKIVGYVQYFGYPLYLDLGVFLLFIISPFGLLLLSRRYNKNHES